MNRLTSNQLKGWYRFLQGKEKLDYACNLHNSFINNSITIVGWRRIFTDNAKRGTKEYQTNTKNIMKEIGLFYLIGSRAQFNQDSV